MILVVASSDWGSWDKFLLEVFRQIFIGISVVDLLVLPISDQTDPPAATKVNTTIVTMDTNTCMC